MSNEMDVKTRRKLRAIYVFEVVMFTYLAATAVAQVIIVYFRK
jgi:hypothetical protein